MTIPRCIINTLHRLAGTLFLVSLCVLANDKAAAETPANDSDHSAVVLTLGVATNFRLTLQTLIEQFLERYAAGRQPELRISAASSGALYAHISNGAPIDIFFSADHDRPKKLVTAGLADTRSLQPYATGQLLLAAGKRGCGSTAPPCNFDNAGHALVELANWIEQCDRIALANPLLAPYGQAANHLLEQLLGNEAELPDTVIGQNVMQAHQFLATGHVSAALLSTAQSKTVKTASCAIPIHYYPAIIQSRVTVIDSTRSRAEQSTIDAFYTFLASNDAVQTITNSGYLPPPAAEMPTL